MALNPKVSLLVSNHALLSGKYLMETASEDALLVKSEMDVKKKGNKCLFRGFPQVISFKDFIFSSVMGMILFMFRLLYYRTSVCEKLSFVFSNIMYISNSKTESCIFNDATHHRNSSQSAIFF
jgi:hypothetical protein